MDFSNLSPIASWSRTLLMLCVLLGQPVSGWAWGDEGHAIVALIAAHYMRPSVSAQVERLLAGDTSGLTADTGMAREASWADRYRDADRDTTREHYLRTRQWHYVDVELDAPDLKGACFGFPPLPAGVAASQGPADDCVVDKMGQFTAELRDPHTPVDERRLALQFLLHLAGDLHQPLHAADRHDQGGNLEHVEAPGLPPQNLHRYWDVEFVAALGTDAQAVADSLIREISAADLARWQRGTPVDWALESAGVARQSAYAGLGSDCSAHVCQLSAPQVNAAVAAIRVQLERAGVRLALVLNDTVR